MAAVIAVILWHLLQQLQLQLQLPQLPKDKERPANANAKFCLVEQNAGREMN